MSETATESTTVTKATRKKTSKKPAKARAAAPKTKPPKAAKPRVEKAPRESREGWGTFALRLPVPERDAIHARSGPAGASRFARIVLNAFANASTTEFENALAEAKKLQ